MTLSDIITRVRYLLTEPDSSGRFSDAELTSHVNAACRDVSQKVRFPEIQVVGTTSANVQEYALPEDILEVKRVYLAGQRIPRTDIATLEGESFQLYDQTSPTYQPQWKVAGTAAYPVASDQGFPAPITQAFFSGMRPLFYERGGNIGFTYTPNGAFALLIEGIALAPDLVNLTDISLFPRYYVDAISWGAVVYAMFADRNESAYPWAQQGHESAMGTLRDTLEARSSPKGPKPFTARLLFDAGNYGGYVGRGPYR